MPPDCPRPFLQSHPPKKQVSSPALPEHPTTVMSTWPGFCPSPRDAAAMQTASGFTARPVNLVGMTGFGLTSPPSSSAGLVSYLGAFDGPTASAININNLDTESVQSIEEEKVQQLKHV